MSRWPSKAALSLGLMCAVLLLLPVLAVLQYRWVGQVSQAERERMQANLLKITTRFAEDFDHEVARELANASISYQRGFEIDPNQMAGEYARQYKKWQRTTQYPKLFRRGCLAEITKLEAPPQLSCFDPQTGNFEKREWPVEFAFARERLVSFAAGKIRVRTPADDDRPIITAPLISPQSRPRMVTQSGQPPQFSRLTLWSITELNLDFLGSEFLAAMIQRHFGHADGLDYDVDVVSRADPRVVLYRSDSKRSPANRPKGDAVVNIFDIRAERLARFSQGVSRPANLDRGQWQLVVNHRAGSLESVVGDARLRNLVIGSVVLLLLGASILMIIISTRRAQRLLQTQMEFVAGISHEFRTPLAVICSAGANLADGIVTSDPKAQYYGDLIQKEGKRLSELVEQVLGFSSAQSGWTHYDLQPVDVNDVVERSVAACQSALDDAHCRVESIVEPGLPQIMADTGALERCIKNLIGNATKYAHESGWIGVFADHGENESGAYLRIRVEDKGPGIKEADLPHIFEPFYRSRDAVEARVHGAGLGLSLVKKIIEQHSGRVKVSGIPGGGTCFALYLPIANETAGAN